MPALGEVHRMPTRAPGDGPRVTPAMTKAGSDIIRRDRHSTKRPSDIAEAVYRAMDAERRKEEVNAQRA